MSKSLEEVNARVYHVEQHKCRPSYALFVILLVLTVLLGYAVYQATEMPVGTSILAPTQRSSASGLEIAQTVAVMLYTPTATVTPFPTELPTDTPDPLSYYPLCTDIRDTATPVACNPYIALVSTPVNMKPTPDMLQPCTPTNFSKYPMKACLLMPGTPITDLLAATVVQTYPYLIQTPTGGR